MYPRATGILPQVTYQVKIYQLLQTTALMSLVLVGVWGSVSTFAILSLGFWFDKIGRRNALVSHFERSVKRFTSEKARHLTCL